MCIVPAAIVCTERERETIDRRVQSQPALTPPKHRATSLDARAGESVRKWTNFFHLQPILDPLTFDPVLLLAGVVKDFKGRGKGEDVTQQCTVSRGDLHLYCLPPPPSL